MPVSLTTPGWSGARNNASVHVAFRETDNVGTRNFQAFAAQWLAYALPYRRFDGTLADAAARLGANADCSALFVDFIATTAESDFSGSCITGYGSSPFRCGHAVSTHKPNPRPPGSRTKSFHICQGL